MTERIDVSQYAFSQIKPNHSIFFSRPPNNEQVGKLDFNGEKMTFEGEADESAKIFFDFLAGCFAKRLEEERAAEREACAKECDYWAKQAEERGYTCKGETHIDGFGDGAASCAAAIRARGGA